MQNTITIKEACIVVVDDLQGQYRMSQDIYEKVRQYVPGASDLSIKTCITRDIRRLGIVKRISLGLYETVPEPDRIPLNEAPGKKRKPKQPARNSSATTVAPGTLRAKIEETCSKMTGTFSAGQIADIMKKDDPSVNVQTITVSVSRDLKQKGIIKRHSRGIYSYVPEPDRIPLTAEQIRSGQLQTARSAIKKQKMNGSQVLSHEFNMSELGEAVFDHMQSMREAIFVQETEIKELKKEMKERLERREETIKHLNTKIRQMEVQNDQRQHSAGKTFKLGEVLSTRP